MTARSRRPPGSRAPAPLRWRPRPLAKRGRALRGCRGCGRDPEPAGREARRRELKAGFLGRERIEKDEKDRHVEKRQDRSRHPGQPLAALHGLALFTGLALFIRWSRRRRAAGRWSGTPPSPRSERMRTRRRQAGCLPPPAGCRSPAR